MFNPEPTFPIAHDCHMDGELLGGGKLDILLDTGASKSYMSKAFYLNNPHLHKFPKFQSAMTPTSRKWSPHTHTVCNSSSIQNK